MIAPAFVYAVAAVGEIAGGFVFQGVAVSRQEPVAGRPGIFEVDQPLK